MPRVPRAPAWRGRGGGSTGPGYGAEGAAGPLGRDATWPPGSFLPAAPPLHMSKHPNTRTPHTLRQNHQPPAEHPGRRTQGPRRTPQGPTTPTDHSAGLSAHDRSAGPQASPAFWPPGSRENPMKPGCRSGTKQRSTRPPGLAAAAGQMSGEERQPCSRTSWAQAWPYHLPAVWPQTSLHALGCKMGASSSWGM